MKATTDDFVPSKKNLRMLLGHNEEMPDHDCGTFQGDGCQVCAKFSEKHGYPMNMGYDDEPLSASENYRLAH